VADPAVSAEAVRRLDSAGMAIASIELRQPSLDDVFLTLTGRPAEPEPTEQLQTKEAA
jgi:oleandomycin transport system ATP-binding protein